jgi:hypothetical protein
LGSDRVGLHVVVIAFAAVAVFACTRSSVTLGSGEVQDVGFAPVDAGPASADVDAGPGLCIATTCPAPWATCPGVDGKLPTYACGTDLSTNVDHCGACGVVCRTPSAAYNIHMGCAAGQCQAFCNEGTGDCNAITDDGCEASFEDDPANCGACGAKCPAGVACKNGKCGCPQGTTECNGQCVDLQSDDANCGGCNVVCAEQPPADAGALRPHMEYGCNQGKCQQLRCVQNASEFWSDCNQQLDPDGCEVDLRHDAAHCGSCTNACDPGQQCFSTGAGPECQCKQGQTLCESTGPINPAYCADTENDPKNCGACGYVCPFQPGARAVCSHGRCDSECLPGKADCNGRSDDGCEADLDKDPRNCGACGSLCAVGKGQPCIGGRCATEDCNGGPVAK